MSTHMGKLRRLSSNVDLTEGSIARGLIAFALPLFLGQLLQQLYNMTDAWVVGNFASNDAFAAVSLSGNLTFLIVGFFNGIAIGGGVVISRYFGARDDLGIERSIHANFLFGLIASVLSTIIGLILSPILLRWMNTPESVMGDALTYFRIYFGGVSTVIMYNICMAIMRAVGDSLHPLYYLMISSASNVVLDLLFVAVFKWGVAGAATATSLGYVVAFCMSMISIWRKREDAFLSIFSKVSWKLEMGTLRSVFKVSSSAVVEQFFMRVGFFLYAKIVAGLGTVDFATHQVCMNIMNISFGFGDGFNVASSSLVGQSLGARRPDMAKLYVSINQRMAVVCSTGLAVILILFRYPLVGLFSDDPQVIARGGILLIMIACVTHAQTSQVIISGSLRGAGDTKFVAICSMISIAFVRPILSWLLAYPVGWGLIGAWIAVLVDQYMRLVFFFMRFKSGAWTKIEL